MWTKLRAKNEKEAMYLKEQQTNKGFTAIYMPIKRLGVVVRHEVWVWM